MIMMQIENYWWSRIDHHVNVPNSDKKSRNFCLLFSEKVIQFQFVEFDKQPIKLFKIFQFKFN